jgi:hypothetical protein
MRQGERFPYPRPSIRPLKIYAFDPMVARDTRTKIAVETRNEPLAPGPRGPRIVVVDYDATRGCFYTPVNLDDPAVLMQGGIDHSEGDPRFHQQMVYAVASQILGIFDRALGRPFDLGSAVRGGPPRPLRIFPHAFEGQNAYYEPQMGALLFGYFRATSDDAGANIPGQLVFSCLSHDVVAHELTHALIDRLSPRLQTEVDNPDAYALHEGLSDLVPMLHRFSFGTILREEVRRTRGRLDTVAESPLFEIAAQFGAAVGLKYGLRNARMKADTRQYSTVMEPHARGGVFMSAVMDALFQTYQAQVRDLFQIAGSPQSPGDDDLHPDLVGRIATEAARAAAALLTMCIRAFDYLPPVAVTFGDFLRAVVTADKELNPDDTSGQRAALIESFRRRGIYASGVRSSAEESLLWDRADRGIAPLPGVCVSALTQNAQAFRRIRPEEGERASSEPVARDVMSALRAYARTNARALRLAPDVRMDISRPRYSFRVAPDGQLVVEIIIQIVQKARRITGVTVVASADGSIRYVIPNHPLPRFEPPPEEAKTAEAEPKAALKAEAASPPRGSAPFPARYRIAPARYRRLYPELSVHARDVPVPQLDSSHRG